jgi:hypothetical protein
MLPLTYIHAFEAARTTAGGKTTFQFRTPSEGGVEL